MPSGKEAILLLVHKYLKGNKEKETIAILDHLSNIERLKVLPTRYQLGVWLSSDDRFKCDKKNIDSGTRAVYSISE